MKLKILVWTLVAVTATAASGAQSGTAQLPSRASINANYGKLPLTFEANQGQTDSHVRFVSPGPGYSVFLTAGGMVLSLRPSKAVAAQPADNVAANNNSQRSANATLQFKLLGAARNPAAIGEDPQPGRVNYFIGNDPAKWHRNVPTYARVRYKDVYPGIDLVYYGNHQQLEYDFAIAPGADPRQIQFEIKGANQINLDGEGNLVLQTGNGELHFQSPVVYQESNGLRVPVQGAYVMNDSTHVAFDVAQYDASKPLVIDPVLVYSTYLGGSGNDQPTGIAVDSTGSVYIAGYTSSTDFPLATLGSIPAGPPHVFVAKLNPAGSNLVYADYIGGNGQDYGFALVLDSANDVYVTGTTDSSNFPMVNPYQGSYPGSFNAFLTKISADGSSLLYSTYLGGNGSDEPSSMAIDSLGSVLVAGNTSSTNFPVFNAYQATASPNQDGSYGSYGFLTKFNPDGSSLIYSTYLSGNSNVALNCGGNPCWPSPYSAITGIALDANGNTYAAGVTNTYNFPTTPSAYLPTNSTLQDNAVGFVSKLSSSGSLDYSTYFYESSGQIMNLSAIAVDGSGSAYVTGITLSDGTFPITATSICDPSVEGWGCNFAFVTKFDPTGSTLLYSTFLGANNNASPEAIALDANHDAYILASTSSTTFGTVNGIEPFANGSELLLVEIDASASTELFATYLGASGSESPAGIALDSNGSLYIAGSTDATDFPVTPSAFQSVSGGNTDAFLLKIGAGSAPAVSLNPTSLQYASQPVGSSSQPQTVLLRNMGSSALSISSIATTGDFAQTDNCGNSVPAAGSCAFSVVFTPAAPGSRSGTVVIADDAAGSPHSISLSGSGFGAAVTLTPSSLSFTSVPVGTSSAAQTITLTNSGDTTLSVSGIQTTGDFAQTNNCPATLAAESTCAINVTFAPTTTGARNGTVTIADSAAGSPQTEGLSGAGLDFGLSSSTSSETIKAGSTATYSLRVAPVGGTFSNAVKLSCSGAPSNTTCSLSASSVTPGVNPAAVTLTITTTATSAEARPLRLSRNQPLYAVWMQFQGLGLFGLMLAGSKRHPKKLPVLIALVLLVGAMLLMSACAGGTGIGPPPHVGTTPGTYTITVSGTSGALQHSLPLTLIVQ